MNNITTDFERQDLIEYAEKAYLNYSMYVVLDRALPHIGDGLKPVQRRIVYAMSELGLNAGAKFKKSARTVGDVIGKFHPHGDTAVYEAMILMAQSFSYRYPLIDGQGNWGSTDDPKSFAAMRYTESRLTKYASTLLAELTQGNVEWVENFDGTLKEPEILPATIPNIILNGASGIAVGMTTDIPPHNLSEVGAALIALLDNPSLSVEDLMQYIQGPDYTSDAPIVNTPSDIQEMYRSGRGSIKQQAKWQQEEHQIVITALPMHSSGAKVMDQIGSQMVAKKLPMITDLVDESDDSTRLVIELKSKKVDAEQLMAHLFATTDLERSHRVNMNVIGIAGKPGVMPLNRLLSEWLQWRTAMLTKRLNHRLQQIAKRLHLLAGLLIAFLNIDEVIHIIRTADDPHQELKNRFPLDDIQVKYILDTRLRQLARLEEMEIQAENDKLQQEQAELQKILASKARMKTLLKTELKKAIKEHGDARKTPITQSVITAKTMAEDQLITNDPVTIVLSEHGWVKMVKSHDFDLDKVAFKTGDNVKLAIASRNKNSVAFIDNQGKSYSVLCHQLPSARGRGEPLKSWLQFADDVSIVTMASAVNDQRYLLYSSFGYGYVCQFQDMLTNKKAGKAQISLPVGSEVKQPVPIANEDQFIAVFTTAGRMLCFQLDQLPVLAKGKGNKLINIPKSSLASSEEVVYQAVVVSATDDIVIVNGKRQMTLTAKMIQSYMGERGRRGQFLARGFRNFDKIMVVKETTD